MGKIVVTEFVSLDGVVEDPGGSEDYRYGGGGTASRPCDLRRVCRGLALARGRVRPNDHRELNIEN